MLPFSEASLLVPDLTIYVYGSSCNSLFFCPNLSGSFFVHFLASYPVLEMPKNKIKMKYATLRPKIINYMNCRQ